MEPDPGDVDSPLGGLSLLDPLLDRILADSVCQQQGWLRVYGKMSTHAQSREEVDTSREVRGHGLQDHFEGLKL